ncbi:LacI family DNA-binding transcriptional regulator [Geminisphaera colitermitum]|uniref:LacI family DNA-binding transcriptional regulator n=1 Tax=Geminisphaera colitermitum TaxID=1148786 RepID=UPI000158D0AB|nr:LacI family DNA-binding transcriptional regulator [Geminisphaera colitermitum]
MNDMTHRITLKHIAEAAGVTAATVSMALRNSPRISMGVRERVRRLATEMNYQPDPLIAALAGRRGGRGSRNGKPAAEIGTIAYVTAFAKREGWRCNRFSPAVFAGACERAAQQGYRVEHFWLREPGMTARRLSEILRSRGIRGVCVAPLPEGFGHMRLRWEWFSCAAVGYSMIRPSLHRACPHQFQGMMHTLKTLRRQGFRRIGVAMEKRVSRIVVHNWLAAILVFQQMHGASSVERFNYETPDRERLSEWITEHHPDAMICTDVALLAWARAAGGAAMGLAQLDALPGYAGLDQRPEVVGAAVIDLITGQIQRNETGIPADPKVTMVEGRWVEGPFTAIISPAAGAGRWRRH